MILENRDAIPLQDIRQLFESANANTRLFADITHFRPEKAGLPTLFFTDIGYAPCDDDIDLHEVVGLSETTESLEELRSMAQVLHDLRRPDL